MQMVHTDRIGAVKLRRKLGVSRTQFDNMVAEGCFGRPVRYGGERSQRYFDVDAVDKFFRMRETPTAAAIARRVMA
jgi:predicted DNA-binding transcriptional regulator AlpA